MVHKTNIYARVRQWKLHNVLYCVVVLIFEFPITLLAWISPLGTYLFVCGQKGVHQGGRDTYQEWWGWGWGWGGGWSWVLFLALKLIVKWSGWGGVGCFLKQDWHCQGTHALVWWLIRKNIFNEWFAFALNDHFDREDFFTCFPSKWQYWHDAYRFRD